MTDERKTDAEAAERVMGWRWRQLSSVGTNLLDEPDTPGEFDGKNPDYDDHYPGPHYSTNASDAEQVKVAMAQRGMVYVETSYAGPTEMYWSVAFLDKDDRIMGQSEGTGPTAAPFVCKAALDASAPRIPKDKSND